jgi:hypothetical protein
MKLYYKKTDGGAEYYCLNHIGDGETGDLRTAVLRTDGGDELELLTHSLTEQNIKVIIKP